MKGELEAEKKQKTKEEVEAGRRIEKLEEYISTSRKTLAEHKKLKNTLEQGGENPEDQRGAGRRDEATGRRESRQDRKFPPKRETGTSRESQEALPRRPRQ